MDPYPAWNIRVRVTHPKRTTKRTLTCEYLFEERQHSQFFFLARIWNAANILGFSCFDHQPHLVSFSKQIYWTYKNERQVLIDHNDTVLAKKNKRKSKKSYWASYKVIRQLRNFKKSSQFYTNFPLFSEGHISGASNWKYLGDGDGVWGQKIY